ncbi:DUF3140 domain-containing protein [Phytoactinopolyspora endophytica]|uniref:DUF3140 domain-containing protein n=1 Tax=Phytoactinopolyspora endophytica TaxID=1642495 RepID=UPI00101D294D|nr:DUF3140 domain-containing protein [Phytoactinopolyspora endophytica]
MAERISPEVDELWEHFHQVVNMTSRELLDWLGVEPDLSHGPGPARRAPLGIAVANILAKRRTDLTVEDLAVMQKVVDIVDEETSEVPREFLIDDEHRRHRLMNIGHDPVRDEQYQR